MHADYEHMSDKSSDNDGNAAAGQYRKSHADGAFVGTGNVVRRMHRRRGSVVVPNLTDGYLSDSGGPIAPPIPRPRRIAKRKFRTKFPTFSCQLLNIALSINNMSIRKEGNEELYIRKYFLLKASDVNMLGFLRIKDSKAESLVFCLLGLHIHLKGNLMQKKYQFSPKFLSILLLAVVLFITAVLTNNVQALATFLSTFVLPSSQLTIQSFLLLYRSCIAFIELSSAIFNNLAATEGDTFTLGTYYFHYRIWLFLFTIPALATNYHPTLFLVMTSVVIEFFDALISDHGTWHLCWNKINFKSIIFGYEDMQRTPFDIFNIRCAIDSESLVKAKPESSILSRYLSRLASPSGLQLNWTNQHSGITSA